MDANIEQEMKNIKFDLLKLTFLNFEKRLNLVIEKKVVILKLNEILFNYFEKLLPQLKFGILLIKKQLLF